MPKSGRMGRGAGLHASGRLWPVEGQLWPVEGLMSIKRSTFSLVAVLGVLAMVAAACGGTSGTGNTGKEKITVGGFKFPESSILAQLYGQALAHAGYQVSYELNIGQRELVAPALKNGDIDLYPGYTASDLEYWNNKAGEAGGDAAACAAKL